ncbi:MAG: phage holin family protein [Bdellovibrionales bacterium]|nr:phage holin family protein [Ramlibacter sp.]
MLHPIFSVLIKRPDLVVEHMAGYAALAKQEVHSTGSHLVQRLLAWVLVLFSAGIFLVLAGVALMLGMTLDRFNWALVLVPGVMLVICMIGAIFASKPMPPGSFELLKQQLDADVHALHAAGDAS